MIKKEKLKEIMLKYDINIEEIKDRSLELCENKEYYLDINNLIYFGLDIAIDKMKLNIINYIEDNKLEKETGIKCISDIDVSIKKKEDFYYIAGLLSEIDISNTSIKNIKLYLLKHKQKQKKKEKQKNKVFFK